MWSQLTRNLLHIRPPLPLFREQNVNTRCARQILPRFPSFVFRVGNVCGVRGKASGQGNGSLTIVACRMCDSKIRNERHFTMYIMCTINVHVFGVLCVKASAELFVCVSSGNDFVVQLLGVGCATETRVEPNWGWWFD